MRTVYLDIGNTTLTFAEPADTGWKILFKDSINTINSSLNKAVFLNEDVELITCSVREDIVEKLMKEFPVNSTRVFTIKDVPDLNLNYKTPETLGIDRFMVCLGAVHLLKSGAIVIDAGSACTVDYMTPERIYQGGVIMPGLKLFQRAAKEYLPELPGIDTNLPDNWPGKSTKECLQWGINGSYITAIESFVKRFKDHDGNAGVAVTGGNGAWITKHMSQKMKIIHEPNLIFEGMRLFDNYLNAG